MRGILFAIKVISIRNLRNLLYLVTPENNKKKGENLISPFIFRFYSVLIFHFGDHVNSSFCNVSDFTDDFCV